MSRVRIIFYTSIIFITSHFLGLPPLFEVIIAVLAGLIIMYLSGFLISQYHEGGNYDGRQKSFTDYLSKPLL